MPLIAELAHMVRSADSAGADDADLLLRFAEQRDEAAFEALVWRYGGMVLATCRRILGRSADAADAFQITLLTLARRVGSVRTGTALPGWLHRVACRAAGKVEAATRRAERTGGELPEPTVEPTLPDDLRLVLDEEIDRLPEKVRRAFVLCHLEGVTNETAAERLGCPHGNVLSHLSRAREQLRDRQTRRGVALAALPLVAVASPPSAATAATARSAVQFASGFGPTGVSSHVLSITHGLLRTVRFTQRQPFALALLAVIGVGLAAVVGHSAGKHAQSSELKKESPAAVFIGTASATGTYKRPLLVVDGKRYELKASDKADKSVAETLTKFSKGDTGTYAVKGVLGTVNGGDGIVVEGIAAAKPAPGTGTPDPAKTAGYAVYNLAVKATPRGDADHQFRLVIPDGLKVVRGILVVGPYSGGDSRAYHEQVWYREFLNLHGFAFLGATNYYLHDYMVMQAALKQFAETTKHPELVNAPYAVTGFSAGGGYTRKLMHAAPDRVIAGVVVGSTMKLKGDITDDHRRVPMLVINGELERVPDEGPGMASHLEPVLAEHRLKGALWGWMAVQGVGHEFAGQEVLTMPMLDAAVRLRYPADADVTKGPIKLKPVDADSGWVADNTTWTSGLTAVTAANTFKGEVAKSSWLLNEDIAFVYRAYSTLDWPLKITSPGREAAKGEVFDAGGFVTIKVDDSKFAGWKKLELYDGAKKVGELTEGKAEFKLKDLKVGYHAYSVLGTDGKGNSRPSNPVLVVVRKPADGNAAK